MELCLYQGSFNPVHNAHLRVAEYVIEKKLADKIIFIPAYQPPHKCISDISAKDRFNLLNLALKPYNEFEISDIEYNRGGISYTYITICELYKLYKPEKKIKFIIGTDAFKKIESWYETDKLKELVDFILFVRENDFKLKDIEYLREKRYHFTLTDLEYQDISSTELRKLIRDDKDFSKFVPKAVEEYIKKHELYK